MTYQPRFIPNTHEAKAELVNLFHLARTALSGGDDSKWARRVWASKAYHAEHPEVTSTAAYKDLEGLLAWD